MPRLTVDLNALDSQCAAGRTVIVYPVWGDDAYRLGQGVLADGSAWLPNQLTEVTGPDGMTEFEIPSSADIGNARYVVTVPGGPTWTNILMPDEDAILSRELLGGNPPDDPALFRPSDIDSTNPPMVGWYLSVAEGDDWTFIPQEQGQPGPQGPQGRYERHIYMVAATAPTAPAGDGTSATPTGWSDTPLGTVPQGSKEYISSSTVDPATDSATPWSFPAEFVAGALATRGPAGPPGRGIVSIVKMGTTVTVTYTSGTPDTFTVLDGAKGNPGNPGDPGRRGSLWAEGTGNPTSTTIPSPLAGDLYLDETGRVWRYSGTSWGRTTINLRGPATPGTSGLDQDQVDARIAVLRPADRQLPSFTPQPNDGDVVTYDGDEDEATWKPAPSGLPDSGSQDIGRVLRVGSDQVPFWDEVTDVVTDASTSVDARIADWAETANTDPIPASKLTNAPSGTGGAGAVALTQVGGTITISGAATIGPLMSALEDLMFLELTFDRGGETQVKQTSWIRKADVDVLLGSAYKLQLQGGGGSFINVYRNTTPALVFGAPSTGYTNLTIRIFNAEGGSEGPPGEPGQPGPGFDSADYVIDTYGVAMGQLPVFTVDSWADLDADAREAGIGIGWWTAGNRPTAYTDVTWANTRVDISANESRLWALRVPSGFPPKFARFNWVRGGQPAPQPGTPPGNFWHPFTLTGSPKEYDIYYLARGVDEFEAVAVQSGDHVTPQAAVLSYNDLLAATTEVQQGLDESLRHVHDLIDPITAEVAARGTYNPVTDGGHFRHGWANIAADGTDTSGNDHLTLNERDYVVNVAAAGSRVPVVWTPIGSDPDEWRVELFRGNTAIVTYPESGEYWRSYEAARRDDLLGHYDAWFLASETSDAPVSKTWQANDVLRLLRGAAVTAIRVPAMNLEDDAVEDALGLPPTAAANRGQWIRRKSNADGFEYVDEPSGGGGGVQAPFAITPGNTRVRAQGSAIRMPITSITAETQNVFSALQNNTFLAAQGIYDFIFGVTLYSGSSGTGEQTSSQTRVNLLLSTTGNNIEDWQLSNPYHRPIGGVAFGPDRILVRVWVPAMTRIGFMMEAPAQSNNGWLGIDSIDVMKLA